MQPSIVGYISRASSSTALSTTQQKQVLDATYDDLTIAQTLLHPSRYHRPSSIDDITVSQQHDLAQLQSTEKPVALYLDSKYCRLHGSSNTWTSSSGGVIPDQDEVDDRTIFIWEYNLLAKKHGIRSINLEVSESNDEPINISTKSSGWFSRKILRRASSTQSVKHKPVEKQLKHKRSFSDLSLRLKVKKDRLKDKDLQELARLCGQSLIYLPTDYAAGSLSVPTCFRATAQYLVKHGINARGIFRIPGSHNTVMALYNHYCSSDEHGEAIAGTVRCPTLPEHIRYDVYDVASAFKKFLSGLPGGILGSLSLFDAFISIQTQLNGSPESTGTKQSWVRARLIALAIATLQSQYRRELICAVFGLLCMIGRTSETARREDDHGRPLPTVDQMGYGSLGIVFGPLLLGDLLEDYPMHLANPHSGLVLLPINSRKSRKETKKEKQTRTLSSEEAAALYTHVDKIKVANDIAELLITHWRDIVCHMRSLSVLKVVSGYKSLGGNHTKAHMLRPSASESFAIRKPPDWDNSENLTRRMDRSMSPTPTRLTAGTDDHSKHLNTSKSGTLQVRKQRSRIKPLPSQRLSGARSFSILSPTMEEAIRDCSNEREHYPLPLKEVIIMSSPSEFGIAHPPSASKHLNFGRKKNFSSLSTSDKENEPPQRRKNQAHYTTQDKVISAVQQGVIDTENRLALPIIIPVTASKKLIKQGTDASSPSKSQKLKNGPAGLLKQKEAPTTFEPQVPNQSRGRTSTKPKIEASNSHIQPLRSRRSLSLSREHESNQDSTVQRTGGRPERTLDVLMPAGNVDKSRLLYDPPERKHDLIEVSKVGVPLRASIEEDISSASTLSQALTSVVRPTEVMLEISSPKNIPSSGNIIKTPSRFTRNTSITPGKNVSTTDFPIRNHYFSHSSSTYSPYISQPVLQAQQTTRRKAIFNAVASSSKKDITIRSILVPVEQATVSDIEQGTNIAPRSPSKISALVAKFNNQELETPIPAPISSSTSRSPGKIWITDAADGKVSPKQSIIAPYTTNPPSPTRSRTTSTPPSTRSPTYSNERLALTPVKCLTPRQVLRASLDDPRPLRPVHGSSEAARTPSPFKSPTLFPVYLRPVHSPLEASPANMGPHTPRPLATERKDGSSYEQQRHPPSSLTVLSATGHLLQSTVALFSTEASFIDQCNEMIHTSGSEPYPILQSFDGPSSATSWNGTQLPRAEPPHLARPLSLPRYTSSGFVEKADFVHPVSSLREVSTSSNTGALHDPHCSNSLLFSQVGQLQQQLATKIEELQHLRQESESKQNLDVETLSKQLREAKREIRVWRTRAEAAEKQVEIWQRIPSTSNSHYAPDRSICRYEKENNSLYFTEHQQGRSTEHTAAEGNMVDRLRKAFQDMDGTTSVGG